MSQGTRVARKWRFALFALAVLGVLGASLSSTRLAGAQPIFEEVTESTGVAYTGRGFGASWGDLNSDGWPDLWVGNHQANAILYLNRGDGTFEPMTVDENLSIVIDTHSATWVDFDNDGDQDVMVVAGSLAGLFPSENLLFVNRDDVLVQQANEYGVANPDSGGMNLLWWDRNRDGLLDVLQTGQNEAILLEQQSGGFVIAGDAWNAIWDNSQSRRVASLGELTGDGVQEIVSSFDVFSVYDITSPLEADITDSVGLDISHLVENPELQEIAIADFNGDLEQDIFLGRSFWSASDVRQISPTSISGLLLRNDGLSFSGMEMGVFFNKSPLITPTSIFIGAGGRHPNLPVFTLSKNDPSAHGIMDPLPVMETGVFIGYDVPAERWTVVVSNDQEQAFKTRLMFTIESMQAISQIEPIGFALPASLALQDLLFINEDGTFNDAAADAGLGMPTGCPSVAAGDFDNDMDIDLFSVCRTPLGNSPNTVDLNDGSGNFERRATPHGAEGTFKGSGSSVSVADYDLDGFLDLFVTNSDWTIEFINFGPNQLFRNLGNDNHWIEIDLEGILSNRDGIGARVIVEAGGVSQLREQSGGVHHSSQSHQRIHFGLGANTIVDSLRVVWPSGHQQDIESIPADHVVRVLEDTNANVNGVPSYSPGMDRGVFVWRDQGTNELHLRASGDGRPTSFEIQLLSSQVIQITEPVGLEPGDELIRTPNGFHLVTNVAADESGLDLLVPSGSTLLIAVKRDGLANPRDVHLGESRLPPRPSGWITPLGLLSSASPTGGPGELGLLLDADLADGVVHAILNGDVIQHRARTMIFSDRPLQQAFGMLLEAGDSVDRGIFTASLMSRLAAPADEDGMDVVLTNADAQNLVGIAYFQDGLPQHQFVNLNAHDLGPPNAYLMQLP